MGINWDELWGKAKDAAEDGFNDIIKTGVPALQSSLEKWGIQVLSEQNQRTQAQLNESVQELLSRPDDGSGFGHFLSESLQQPVLQKYGLVIVGGVGALIVLGIYLKRG